MRKESRSSFLTSPTRGANGGTCEIRKIAKRLMTNGQGNQFFLFFS